MASYPIVTHSTPCVDGKIQIRRIESPRSHTHQHTFFELIYVVQGTAVRRMADAAITVSTGDYYVADPYSTHCHEESQDFEIVSCLFLPEYIDRAMADCPSISSLLSNKIMRFGVPVDLPLADRVLHDTDGSVRRIIKQMEKEYNDCRTGYMEMLRCYLTQVLVSAARACEARVPHEAVAKVMEYLKSHYTEPLSLDTLSELVGYTPQYLSSLFSEDVGMSIQIFLQRMRIEEACRMLAHTNLSVSEISAAVGYQDTRHFAKVFRRHQVISPREYRKAAEAESK